jgi:hypothetical protein
MPTWRPSEATALFVGSIAVGLPRIRSCRIDAIVLDAPKTSVMVDGNRCRVTPWSGRREALSRRLMEPAAVGYSADFVPAMAVFTDHAVHPASPDFRL